MKPLEGIKVLDLTHMLAGPYAGMVLADLGADVVKVEPLGTGEMTRGLLSDDPNNSFKGFGAYFLTLNRNKKSVSLDLKDAQGLDVFYDLVKSTDVVLNNFSAGVVKKLKIDYDHLSKINSKIITCSITGFGETGKHSSRPAYDQIVQAYSGGMSITGADASTPTRAGIPIGDLGSGLFSVIGMLSALLSREKTGKGQHLDLSLLDVQISLLTYMATMQTLSGVNPEPIGNAHFVHVPYNSFTTQNGFVVIAVITDAFWQELLNIVDIDNLRKEEFKSSTGRLQNQKFIESELNKKLSTETSEHWINALNSAKVPCAPINSFSQALSDEQVIHRNMVVEVDHPDGGKVKMPGNPIKLSYTDEDSFSPPPHLGQHTKETLIEWCNYSESEIEELIKKKVIAT
ncbi:MAG TPA: CoA transferase [Gammaproteobacteria bacterium]|jgi:crotonobetainyl-CoA:carnitine CoA-transferase CaiB-like acyl-CoA transferase|nr:CoA transferase [Gammaproteobacteria bacterium]